jgi:hypothetical protein
MSISASTVWEVRNAGSDTNGGGFVAGATGTDWSQQASPQYTPTGMTSSGAGSIVLYTSASADMVGNIINITGGTNFTTGWYQITAVSVGVSFTTDRASTTGVGAIGTGNIGGALATLNKLAAVMVGSNMAFIKADGTYTTATSNNFSQQVAPAYNVMPSRLRGYGTTRGDSGRCTVKLTSSSIQGILCTGNGWQIENIIVDCNSQLVSTGIYFNANNCNAYNCLVKNYKSGGFAVTGSGAGFFYNEVTGGLSGTGIGMSFEGSACNNYVHDNVGSSGISCSNTCNTITNNIISNTSGATADGISQSGGSTILSNIIYNSGRHGISSIVGNSEKQDIRNNILAKNGGFGIVLTTNPGFPASPFYDGNAFYSNTSGNRSNMDDTGAVNAINAAAPYTNIYDVTLTADPFVNAATGDFRLNNNAGGGAAARGAGLPKAWPGLSITGYADFGTVQHQDSGGGTAVPLSFGAMSQALISNS